MQSRRFIDRAIKQLFFLAATLSVLVLLGIFGMLLMNGIKAFEHIRPSEFFFSSNWNPSAYGKPSYGIVAMLVSTFLVTFGAMCIAVPLGIGAAAYLAQVAQEKTRLVLKPIIELLAAIPSVVVGFIGIVMVGPFIAKVFGLSNGLTALNGSILLAVMSLPTIITVAEDAIRSVPNSFKEGSYALGANQWTTLTKVILPASYSGIIAAIILGMGRAIGETMTVLMATGNALAMPHGFFDPVRTMTATIAIELGEVPYGTTHYYSLFAVGALLFLISLGINLIAENIAVKYRYKA
ncbi:phosphate ABC transporter permease subunit PstC [Haliscomenobacter hydrossis]|uniref:Phosphate transport system permease protein n=1 Tax=Haliscomenobacter hydrossis (strain ATCC 27775 / DSM 1100 / LMG 10767 / O) TaxID=760192 RepID=F4KTH1_HALH1|nr:phosphate ABC transporter permease subunit PstC [Haliscomenobacter hydrossis]AEE52385.1 phosphate ABC transporter, inner membrane subunit PstC [Haliscomenobacter hydrossis DSM 1100]